MDKCRLISVPVKWRFWERCMATLMQVDRVNISSEDSLIGDVITQPVSIVEGAFVKDLVDIHTPG
jgi:hypothetical protein